MTVAAVKISLILLSVTLFLHTALCSIEPIDKIISGTHQVEYIVLDPENLLIPVTVNTIGYSQQVQRIHRGYIVTVTSSIRPIPVTQPFQFNPENLDPRFQHAYLLQNLASAENASDALRACLAWLDRTIIYDGNHDHLQDIESVLQRGSGNCVGRTAVLQKILNGIGLTSRTVRGCLFQNGKLVFHRWIEIDYDQIGALPTAPGTTQDFITPDHLVLLPSDKIDPAATDVEHSAVTISVLNEKQASFVIDQWPSPEGSIVPVYRRKTHPRRIETVLTGEISPSGFQGTVELETSTGMRSFSLSEQHMFSFVPVSPGAYRLSIKRNGREAFSSSGHIRAGEHKHHYCTLKILRTDRGKEIK
jgi:hypothetical protein